MKIKIIAIIAFALGSVFAMQAQGSAPAGIPPASTKTGVTYATDIKAIFDHSCVKCHSGEKPKGHLKLDTLEGIFKGGKDGVILKPGDSANSDVVKAIAHMTEDEDDYMPPLNNKAHIAPLTSDEIGLVRAWIDQGAK